MTIHTGKLWKVGLTMTFKTDAPDIAADQKEAICRSMGSMTDGTSFCFHGEMFEDPGASLFRMTFETDIDIKLIPCPQTAPCAGPMGSMAIRALQCPFQDSMTGRKVELRFDLLMARETESGLFFLEEILCHLGAMNLMTIITSNRIEFMDSSAELEECLLFLMTFETRF
jgi:hypothetical protein